MALVLGSVITVLFFLGCVADMGNHAASAAVPTCTRRCGAVEFAFPFGLDSDDPRCFYSDPDTFSLSCNTSPFHPPKLLRGDFEVIDISIQDAKMRVWMEVSYDCYNASGRSAADTWNVYLNEARRSFSYTDNIFVGIGCDTRAYIDGLAGEKYVGDISSVNYTGGCMSSCESLKNVRDGDCSGIGCCQTSIPQGLRGYSTSFDSRYNHSGVFDFNPCSYSFLVDKNNYTFKASDLKDMPTTRVFPIVFDWFVGNKSCEFARENVTNYACISEHSHCVNSSNGPGYICQCDLGYQGNPYINAGCQDIDECQDPNICLPGEICTNTPGSYICTCPFGSIGDPDKHGCVKIPDKTTSVSAALELTGHKLDPDMDRETCFDYDGKDVVEF